MQDVYDDCLRTAAACSRDRHAARDLVQTVFLSALERGVHELGASERCAGHPAASCCSSQGSPSRGWSVEFSDPDEHKLAFFQLGSLPRALDG